MRDGRNGLWRVKRLIALLVVMALTMGFMATSAGAIMAVDTGTIKGKVVDTNGDPIQNAYVSLVNATYQYDYDSVYTQADGTYEFTDYPIGLYKVSFEHTGKVEQWYDEKPSFTAAQSVMLSDGETLEGIDATLVAGGTIEGTITAGPGVPGVDGMVHLYDASGYGGDWYSSYEDYVSDAAPAFAFKNLAPGNYKIVFYPSVPGVLTQWFDGARTFDTATDIVVTAEETATASMTVQMGATIKGRVTDGTNGLGGAEVTAYNAVGNVVASANATSSGGYELVGLPEGEYRIRAEKGGYLGEFYNDKPTLFAADSVAVSGTEVVAGIDFALTKGQTVKGTVVDATGKRLPFVDVELEGTTKGGDVYSDGARTDLDGTYAIYGVPDGKYKVLFDPGVLNAANTTITPETGLIREYWQDQQVEAAADAVTVESTTVAGIDATLAAGGGIKGTLRDLDGGAVPGASVTILAKFGDDAVQVASTSTNPDGTYVVKGLPAASNYIVEYSVWNYYNDFGSLSFYGGTTDRRQAKLVNVAQGQFTTGIDGLFYGDHGYAAGMVYGSDGKPASYVKVIVARETPSGFVEETGDWQFTGANGAFAIAGVGKFKVRFTDPQGRYDDAFYGGTSAADSKIITLDAGESVPVTQTLSFKSADSAEGADRFATSVAVSKRAFARGCSSIVIATGRNWPDALGGSGLAGLANGPILLVDKDVIPPAVMTEISRLAYLSWVDNVYILGSESVVSKAVEDQLRGIFLDLGWGTNVVRLAGSTRYETAGKIADEIIRLSTTDFGGTALVSTGLNYPDALAASPLAANKGLPLFLVDANGVTDGVANMMASKGIKKAIILGSDKVVSKASADKLVAKFGAANVSRLAGGTRYTTAIEVAKYGVTQGMTWRTLGFATGTNFPDALSGGVLQGINNNVMLLTPGTSLDPSVEALVKEKKAEIFEVRFFGSTAAINKSVRDRIAAARK